MGYKENYNMRKKLIQNKFFAFNVWDTNSGKIILRKCIEMNKLPFIQVPTHLFHEIDLEELIFTLRRISETTSFPMIIHLDHCRDIAIIQLAIELGFDSVMFDGSEYNLADNIRKTSEVAELVHKYGVILEGEIGNVVGNEGDIHVNQFQKASIEDIREFINNSNVDLCAIGIGTQHGLGKVDSQKIDFDLLSDVSESSSIPLAIHGGSGLDDVILKRFLSNRMVNKINLSSDLKNEYMKSLRESIIINNETKVEVILERANLRLSEVIYEKLLLI